MIREDIHLLRVGMTIWLHPFEQEPAQKAEILGIKPETGTLTVHLFPEFITESGDSGMRDVPVDQVDYIVY